MYLIDGFWASLTYAVSFLTLSTFVGTSGEGQTPLSLTSSGAFYQGNLGGPIFKPPGGAPTGPGSDFTCDYSNMVGWYNCSTPDNRGCWLKNLNNTEEYNISTNYEDTNWTPVGITRNYVLNITDQWVNADGLNFSEGKIFNGKYPGPWIQACWGDVRIHFPNSKCSLLHFPRNLSFHTNNIDRMSQSSSTTNLRGMVPVSIGMGFDNG
jgi:hypothetical protein